MAKQEMIYQNKWCKIVSDGTHYIMKSKSNKYNDQYFLTRDELYKRRGLPPNPPFSKVLILQTKISN